MAKNTNWMITGLLAVVAACTGTSTTTDTAQRVSCHASSDCAAAGGGDCINSVCRADNECSTTSECPSTQVCLRSTTFGGLCSSPGTSPSPLPGSTCTTNADCPPNHACDASHTCHAITVTCNPGSTGGCPSTEHCVPLCISAGGTVGYVCQPLGTVTPDHCGPEQCTTDANCPAGERCNPVCGPSTTALTTHVCQPAGVPTQVCPL
ncbi:MAG: hypothetical protein JWO36_3631 [Myxococcales bacterium]|nr:hypothetical protein [Myxococcales bacterium]